ncbi:MAG TPA: transcriptional regulator [Gammaproteobacteria bacterium]|jgi:putative FmdB family regulatory protein|nr:transcriptional regulator [Gammaproteobacteria bacterium]
MPIYEYQCNACDHQLEAIQKMADNPLVDCPECGEATLSKMISAVGFRLSGSGWYETDFKSGSKKNLTESTAAQPKSESKSSGHSCKTGCGCG